MSKRGNVEVQEDGLLKKVFCGFNVIGDFAERVCRGAEIKLDTDADNPNTCTTYCWCCTFWRGVAVGACVGLVFGYLVG